MNQKGITLIELSIVMAVMSIMAMIGVTNMVDVTVSNKNRASAEAIAGAITKCRSEAMRRNMSCVLSKEAGSPLFKMTIGTDVTSMVSITSALTDVSSRTFFSDGTVDAQYQYTFAHADATKCVSEVRCFRVQLEVSGAPRLQMQDGSDWKDLPL